MVVESMKEVLTAPCSQRCTAACSAGVCSGLTDYLYPTWVSAVGFDVTD